MTNPRYVVNISFQSKFITGSTLSFAGGVTYSIPTYGGEYFVASMPEVGLYATGPSYTDALTALLATASIAETPVQPPISQKNTW